MNKAIKQAAEAGREELVNCPRCHQPLHCPTEALKRWVLKGGCAGCRSARDQ